MITTISLGQMLHVTVSPRMLAGVADPARVYVSVEGPGGGPRGHAFADPEQADALALALAGAAAVVRHDAEAAAEDTGEVAA